MNHSVEPANSNAPRLLVADDDPINRKYASMVLRGTGYGLDIVENGLEALEAVETQDYNLIIMDCGMPVMDGFEATEKIRKLTEARGRPAPVIIGLTGFMGAEVRKKCFAAGMDRHLNKPIDPADLLFEIELGLAEMAS